MGGEGQGAKFENKCLTSITQKILDTKKRRRQCDHRGRDWRDVVTSQGIPAITKIWRRPGTDSPLEPQERV